MKITYQSTLATEEDNVKEIKAAIKASDFGSALFFQITAE